MSSVLERHHHSHPHQLKLKRPSAPYFCSGCEQIGFDICYQCETCNNFSIHDECAFPTAPTYHHFFKDCRFEFHEESPITPNKGRDCDVCGMDIKGYVYQCSCNKYDMHPHCTKLPETLTGEGVKLQLKKNASLNCQKCKFKVSSSKGPKGWCYVSTCGNYCLHVACVKQMVYEAWKNSYFNQQIDATDKNDLAVLPSTASPSTSTNIVEKRAKSSSGWKIAIAVLKLILSAIFGDPITGFTALIATFAQIIYPN
ncbi:hypothetical protein P3X46_025545 [Hevea brasiliensis]|uniref:DC1 domain-containing protein n=1 Tax=Hevea brasiliensis TaxID=3981 RepID=A0ABQ9L5V9_HEVBR|nr:uncharacterized protein LOC110650619 [Hevea brasiliensis]KAJ9160114.1 hypothetical protein P3X46_025545 [Hevea brasiliensis]